MIRRAIDRNGKKVWLADLRKFGLGRVYRDSKEAAEHEYAEAIKKRGSALSSDQRETTFGEMAEKFLAHAESGLAGKTIRSYRDLLNRYVLPTFGRKRLVDVNTAMIRNFLTAKRAPIVTCKIVGCRGRVREIALADYDAATMKRVDASVGERRLSQHTVRLIRASMSVVFSLAAADRIIDRNPVSDAKVVAGQGRKARKLSKRAVPKERVFSKEQQDALLAWCHERDRELEDFVFTSLRLGTRPGETRGLKWGDIVGRKITIERSVDDQDVVTDTKTGETRAADVSSALLDVLGLRRLTRERDGHSSDDASFIFGNGEPLDSRKIARRFELALRECEITGHSLYDLRHTCASVLYQRCRDTVYCAKQLGHSPRTFLEHYAHMLPDATQPYAELLDAEDAQAAASELVAMNART